MSLSSLCVYVYRDARTNSTRNHISLSLSFSFVSELVLNSIPFAFSLVMRHTLFADEQRSSLPFCVPIYSFIQSPKISIPRKNVRKTRTATATTTRDVLRWNALKSHVEKCEIKAWNLKLVFEVCLQLLPASLIVEHVHWWTLLDDHRLLLLSSLLIAEPKMRIVDYKGASF